MLYHAVVLEYLTKNGNLSTNSEDMKIIEDIFSYFFHTLVKDSKPRLSNTEQDSVLTGNRSSNVSFFENSFVQDCKLEHTFIEDCLTLLCKHLSMMDKRVIDYIYQIRKQETYFTPNETNYVETAKNGITELINGKYFQIKSSKLIWVTLKIMSKDLKNTRASLAETVRYTSVRDVKVIEFNGKDQEKSDDKLEENFLEILKMYFCHQAHAS